MCPKQTVLLGEKAGDSESVYESVYEREREREKEREGGGRERERETTTE